jgi:quercetin dioxygenase-like cupin family protein
MDIRAIEDNAPRDEHEGSTRVWWLSDAREMFAQTAGGHLELVSEWEVAPGGKVHPHKHPTYEFYYITSGYGRMTIEDETREIRPGDLVVIPPNALHSVEPLTPHAGLHALAFAVALPRAGVIDYSHDQ